MHNREEKSTILRAFFKDVNKRSANTKLFVRTGSIEHVSGKRSLLATLRKPLDDVCDLFRRDGRIIHDIDIEGDATTHLQTIPMTVKRNAYGRQLGSFRTSGEVSGIGDVPMTFIRAPFVADAGDEVEVLASVEDRIVAVRYQKQIALAFHPELDEDMRIHEMFLSLCE